MDINSEAFTAWAAGFFDGEGCVQVSTTKQPNCTGGLHYTLLVSVHQLNKKPLLRIQDRWGGTVVSDSAAMRGDWRKRPARCYRWRAAGEAAMSFLRDVRPYLVVKDDEADIAMDYPLGVYRGKANPLPAKVREKRAEIAAALRSARAAKIERVRIEEYQPPGRRVCPVVVAGVPFPSIKSAAEHLCGNASALKKQLSRGRPYRGIEVCYAE